MSIVPVMIEIPMHSRNKYEFDIVTKEIKFNRMLTTSVQYPADYGFIKRTWGEDNDPLDAVVLVREPTFPGCVIQVRPIGVLKMSDDHGVDHKVLCVPEKDPHWKEVLELHHVSQQMLNEISHFFSVYKNLEDGAERVKISGWGDREEAEKVIDEAKKRYDRECDW